MTSSKNVLITGAFGFVGTNISKGLDHNLIAVDVEAHDVQNYKAFYNWNELDKIDWNKIDAIIHLAGKAHDTKNTSEEQTYFDVNLGLTQKIFGFFLQSKATKFILFSSVKAVADKVSGEQLTEEDQPNPQTAYGKSKLAAENFILGQPLPANKKIYILRPCMIHGPGNKGNLNLLYQIAKKGIPWPLGGFDNKRSFVSIDNLVWTINQLLEKEVEPGIYQIADDQTLSTNRIIELIALANGKNPRIWKLNINIVRSIAKLGDQIGLPLNVERLNKLTESYVVSNQKLKRALAVKSMPVSADEGMKKTLKSF